MSPDGGLWLNRVDDVPPEEALVNRMFGDDRMVALAGGQTATRWDIFAPNGRFSGLVELPPRFLPFDLRGNRVAGVLRDSLDVEYVVVLEVTKD